MDVVDFLLGSKSGSSTPLSPSECASVIILNVQSAETTDITSETLSEITVLELNGGM